MTPKEYLLQIKRIDKLIDTNLEERERLRSLSTSISAPSPGERVKTSRRLSAPHEDIIARLYDLEQEIDRETDILIDLKEQARKAIYSITNNDERLILVYRYIEGRTWESISCELFIDEKTARNWHASALKHMKMPKKPIKI